MSEETLQQQKGRSLNPLEMGINHTHIFQRFVTETGKILPRKVTGLTAKHQRHIAREIKRARNLLLMK
ncbi:MAG: 30S ribosomal protein S18 [Verrucomicrobia bacterium]|nr:MAG: 30S ribosomal protein S18 [Verrucomicrobiota bacterium]